jgi:hypothetical protein
MEELISELEKCFQDLTELLEPVQLKTMIPDQERLRLNILALTQRVLIFSLNLNEGLQSLYSSKKAISAPLLVRANFEAVGILANVYKKMVQFENEEITLEELDSLIYSYTLGSREIKFDDVNVPEPIQVLKGIDAVDHIISKDIGKKDNIFREHYNFLSEFCHPNFHAQTSGINFDSNGLLTRKLNDAPQPFAEMNLNFFKFSHQMLLRFIIDIKQKTHNEKFLKT